MRTKLFTRMLLVVAIACLASTARAADDKKADDKKPEEKKPAAGNVTGTWKWTTTFQGQERENTLKLKQEGDKVTGALVGRNDRETEITDGKIKDGVVSFKITRSRQGQERTTTYTAKLEGDMLKGKVEMPGRDGGAPRPRDWEAMRVKEEEKKEDVKEEKKESKRPERKEEVTKIAQIYADLAVRRFRVPPKSQC